MYMQSIDRRSRRCNDFNFCDFKFIFLQKCVYYKLIKQRKRIFLLFKKKNKRTTTTTRTKCTHRARRSALEGKII